MQTDEVNSLIREMLPMAENIVSTVVGVMLPLGKDSMSNEASTKAIYLILDIFKAKTTRQAVRRQLGEIFSLLEYEAPPGQCGRITDLTSDKRIELLIDTAVCLAFGYMQWKQRQVRSILDAFPAQEFYRAFPRKDSRNWPERWKVAGGRFFPGKSSYPGGRMIALNDDPIWEAISAFGLPFVPYDFLSGMNIRGVKRDEAVQLGLVGRDQQVKLTILPCSDELKRQLAAKLQQKIIDFETYELQQESDEDFE
jgi:hypothetical protein